MTLIFQGGQCRTLWTDDLDLREMGPCHVSRISTIDFNLTTQEWEVRRTDSPNLPYLFSDPSRTACLHWEHTHQELLLTP